ncbi:MAG: DUF192 domain-containing protein [Hyphomicrobiaceae bacterium]|nr:MAG: DUF192 domain-containing protein [Hyphomicrobiaceae bacterium]
MAQLKREPVVIVTEKGEVTIEAEIAESPSEQARGLMFRRSMPERSGMLFPYQGAREVTMWMRNTILPLDMVFIRADGVIHRIEVMTQPLSEETISSQGAVTAVLEINGGAAERLGIKPGQRVRHRIFGGG